MLSWPPALHFAAPAPGLLLTAGPQADAGLKAALRRGAAPPSAPGPEWAARLRGLPPDTKAWWLVRPTAFLPLVLSECLGLDADQVAQVTRDLPEGTIETALGWGDGRAFVRQTVPVQTTVALIRAGVRLRSLGIDPVGTVLRKGR